MEAGKNIFKAIFSRLVEKFTPKIVYVLEQLESSHVDADFGANSKKTLVDIFTNFPKSTRDYQSMVKTLIDLSTGQSIVILKELITMGIQVVENDRNSIFSPHMALLPVYNSNILEHRICLYQTSIYLISDLIANIVEREDVSELHSNLVTLMTKIMSAELGVDNLMRPIFNLWSVVLAYVAMRGGVSCITNGFKALISAGRITAAFHVIEHIDMHEGEDFDVLKKEILQTMRSNELTRENLDSVSNLLVNCDKDETFISQLVELSKRDQLIQTIAKLIIDGNLTKSYIQENIFDTKEPSIRALFWSLTGAGVAKRWVYSSKFEDIVSRELKIDGDGISSFLVDGFMENFFTRGDFSENRWYYVSVLLHLAFRYVDEFTTKVIPKFLEVDNDNIRVAVLLMVIKILNENQCPSTEKVNKAAGAFCKDMFIQEFSVAVENKCVCFECEILVHQAIDHTQSIELFLDGINNDVYKPTVVSFQMAKSSESLFSRKSLLVQVIRYVLDDESLFSMIDLFFELACHPSLHVGKAAYAVCDMLAAKMPVKVARKIVDVLVDCECDEKQYHLVKLMERLVSDKDIELSEDDMKYMELGAVVAMMCIHPEVRIISDSVLNGLSRRMTTGSLVSIRKNGFKTLDSVVKKRILLSKTISSGLGGKMAMLNSEFSSSIVCYSYFYEMWLVVFSEHFRYFISINFAPFLQLIETRLASCKTFQAVFIRVISCYYYPLWEYIESPYNVVSDGRVEQDKNSQVKTYQSIMSFVDSGRILEALKLILCCHCSLYPTVIQILPYIPEEHLAEAARVLAIMLRSPEITGPLMESMMIVVLQFLQVVRDYIIQKKLNSPRVIVWDEEQEELLVANQAIALNYILILVKLLPDSQVSEDDWPIAGRDLTLRLLINWALTTDPRLGVLREYAMNGIVTISRVGIIFTDALLFDKKVIKLLAKYERHGFSVLPYLLFYHTELLIDIFIRSFFSQSRKVSNCYLESIIVLNDTHAAAINTVIGEFLLLIFVMKLQQHPLADFIMNFFLKIITGTKRNNASFEQIWKKLEKEPYDIVIPQVFSYATEAVFNFAFTIIDAKLHIPTNDICNALVPWICNLRLLPKQSQCGVEITHEFNYFTPYQFLSQLMKMSAAVDDDQFSAVAKLWIELMKSPDHKDLVPTFFTSWNDATLKKNIFSMLLGNDPVEITRRLAQHCTFAYYFHVTSCLGQSFSDELWVLPIIFTGLNKYWDNMTDDLANIIHFVYLFREEETSDMFELICTQLAVDLSDNENLVKRIAEQLSSAEEWGSESLKWFIGSKSLKHATTSLAVYNQIQKPALDPSLVARVVLYHIKKSGDDVCDLIMEAFTYLANNFEGNEQFACEFLVSLLDSSIYVQTSAPLLLKILSSRETRQRAWPMIIPMIKPMLSRLERNDGIAKIFDLFIKTSKNEELMMIVAPLKDVDPLLFPSSKPTSELLKTVSEGTCCKCLAHYAAIINSASVRLQDSIFSMCTVILEKVQSHENNRIHLAKLYSMALHAISQSSCAIPFLSLLMQKEPVVSSMNCFDVTESERSLEDVERSLVRLCKPEDLASASMITDCKSHMAIVGFPEMTDTPKILPFVSRREMIDGMIKMSKVSKLQKTVSLRRMAVVYSGSSSTVRSTVMSFANVLASGSSDGQLRIMIHPSQILSEYTGIGDLQDVQLVFSPEDFLAASTV